MAIDPAAGFAMDTAGRSAERLADIERRLSVLERGAPTIQVASGAPTTAPRDGTPFLDTGTNRLYIRSNGAWKYTVLT